MDEQGLVNVLGYPVSKFASAEDASTFFVERCKNSSRGEYVCLANVHMFVEAISNSQFSEVLSSADYVLPDGMPIALLTKLWGGPSARVRGMDLTTSLLISGANRGVKFGFYGASDSVLKELADEVKKLSPNAQLVYLFSPPYRELSRDEEKSIISDIKESDVDILFVGLGCPKQERWMHKHVDDLHCICFGVGAVFDFLAKASPEAPRWMSNVGLEWFFRLVSEPRRLFSRYFRTNIKFLLILLGHFSGIKKVG
tara:strand:- start:6534 stop:7298 length:765 start_codon:yes stop_codon:yes gene_type:complete